MIPVALAVRMVEHVSEAISLTAPVPMDSQDLTVNIVVRNEYTQHLLWHEP